MGGPCEEDADCASGGACSSSQCTDIDECAASTDNCSDDAVCTNTPSSFTCACNAGYSGDGVTCSDVDECTLATDNCDANATCTNTPGSFTCACNTGYTGDGVICTAAGSCTVSGSLTVAHVYPTNGAPWMKHVQNNNGGTTWYDQPDFPCLPRATPTNEPTSCIHGGEKLKVVVTGCASCSNLSMMDALGVFNWTCSVQAGTATFFSQGLKEGKGLRDLVNATSWKPNSVTLEESGTTLATSSSATWWTNTVAAAPIGTSLTSVSASGTIYTIASSSSGPGFIINANEIALVVLPGAIFTHTAATSNPKGCNPNAGSTNNTGSPGCLVLGISDFMWIEGEFNGAGSAVPLVLWNVRFGVFRNLKVASAAAASIGAQITLDGSSSGNRFYDIAANNATGGVANETHGIFIHDSTNNYMSKFSFGNNGESGFSISTNSSENTVTNGLAVGNGAHGLLAWANSKVTVSHVTFANNASAGIMTDDTATASYTFNSILATNNGTFGLDTAAGSGSYRVSQFVATHNGSSGINITASASNNTFSGYLLVGNNGIEDCSVAAATNAGVLDSSSNPGNSCGAQGTSSHVARLGISNAASFYAKVTTDDSSNTSDASGAATYALANDWLHFENMFRVWGRDGAAFPAADHRGRCSTGTCRIWDWRLLLSDTALLNRSNDGSGVNEPFTSGTTCPAAVHGNNVLTDQQTVANTFLRNALEVLWDSIGDDDGLCESNEACIYTPNIGGYQGHGDYLANGTCVFQNGTVSGVTMYAYLNNGL